MCLPPPQTIRIMIFESSSSFCTLYLLSSCYIITDGSKLATPSNSTSRVFKLSPLPFPWLQGWTRAGYQTLFGGSGSGLKSCNGSCSRRACAAFGSGMKSCNGSCSQRACTAYGSVFLLFELSCQTSEQHFAVIYVGTPWVTQKNNAYCSRLLRAKLGPSKLLHADLQTICGSWLTIF